MKAADGPQWQTSPLEIKVAKLQDFGETEQFSVGWKHHVWDTTNQHFFKQLWKPTTGARPAPVLICAQDLHHCSDCITDQCLKCEFSPVLVMPLKNPAWVEELHHMTFVRSLPASSILRLRKRDVSLRGTGKKVKVFRADHLKTPYCTGKNKESAAWRKAELRKKANHALQKRSHTRMPGKTRIFSKVKAEVWYCKLKKNQPILRTGVWGENVIKHSRRITESFGWRRP